MERNSSAFDDSKNALAKVTFNTVDTQSILTQGYSSGVKIQMKPCEKWGSCLNTERDGTLVYM